VQDDAQRGAPLNASTFVSCAFVSLPSSSSQPGGGEEEGGGVGGGGGSSPRSNVAASASSHATFASQIQRLYCDDSAWRSLVSGGFATLGTEGLLLRSVAGALAAALKRAAKPNRVFPGAGGGGSSGGRVQPPPPRIVARLERQPQMLGAMSEEAAAQRENFGETAVQGRGQLIRPPQMLTVLLPSLVSSSSLNSTSCYDLTLKARVWAVWQRESSASNAALHIKP
jgi:hypothetical protein